MPTNTSYRSHAFLRSVTLGTVRTRLLCVLMQAHPIRSEVLLQVTTLMSAIDEVESRPQLSDEEFAALQERVKEQGAVVKASKEARSPIKTFPTGDTWLFVSVAAWQMSTPASRLPCTNCHSLALD